MSFPKNFTWGVATCAYQIEGAAYEDGKGPSVWDALSRYQPNAIKYRASGDVACDHYHRYKADVALMRSLGIKAYRMSVSWPRVLPQGTGAVNPAGLEFYDRLVDELLAAGIQPWVTLFHFDYPVALFDRGWWLNRDSADWFADYAALVADRLSDRVSHWMTMNEPQGFVGSYLDGRHAPSNRITWSQALQAAHHTLLAHGKAVQALRAHAKTPARVSYATSARGYLPASDSAADVEAARRKVFGVLPNTLAGNAWWMDPIYLGGYPLEGLKMHEPYLPPQMIRPGDMETIHQPLDFIGINMYSAECMVRAGANGQSEEVSFSPDIPRALADWIALTPSALYWMPKFFTERYGLPVVVTENGMANVDWIMDDGQVHDPQRIDFLTRYLRELRRAVQAGVDVQGYFYWTLMDNFEWLEGFAQRFGLVHVDFATQKRTPKDSAAWYRKVIASNGDSL